MNSIEEMKQTRMRAIYPKAVARWESKNGRYFVEIRKDVSGYSFLARGAGGTLGSVSEEAAIAKLESELEYYALDGATRMERVI